MSIIGIVAIDRNRAIGKAGTIPWHYSSDMKFFKKQTSGNACVMGRKTWLSLKQPLKNRLNIVMSRSSEIAAQPSVLLLRDKTSVLALVPYLTGDLYVIGGETIYRAFADEIEKWVVTEIPLAVEGADTFMPEDFLKDFGVASTLQLEENLNVVFYERRAGGF